MLIATDTLFFFIRLTIFFVAIFGLLTMVGDVSVAIQENSESRMMTQLSENYFVSSMSVSRGVFDSAKLVGKDGSFEEIARICDTPSGAKFYSYEGGTQKLISTIGYQDTGGKSRDYAVWLKSGERLSPGLMRLTIWPKGSIGKTSSELQAYDALSDIGCAVERAWAEKVPQAAIRLNFLMILTISFYTENDMFCVASLRGSSDTKCRYMPGVNVENGLDKSFWTGIYEITAKPIKKGGVADCNGPDVMNGEGEVGTVLLCEVRR